MLLHFDSLLFPPATPLQRQSFPPKPITNSAVQPQAIVWQAADTVVGNSFVSTSKDYLFAYNTTGGTVTVTLKSSPEPNISRLGDITQTLKAGDPPWVFGPISNTGWMQADGLIYVWCSSSGVNLAALKF